LLSFYIDCEKGVTIIKEYSMLSKPYISNLRFYHLHPMLEFKIGCIYPTIEEQLKKIVENTFLNKLLAQMS
jgi:hypothetical protein